MRSKKTNMRRDIFLTTLGFFSLSPSNHTSGHFSDNLSVFPKLAPVAGDQHYGVGPCQQDTSKLAAGLGDEQGTLDREGSGRDHGSAGSAHGELNQCGINGVS